ncbi:scarecrow-like protein 30 [Lolium rigidum]|uniref:scarecrow-like protein 30 n=1 Tax=Lolium rigidum TaxID=89674 RepID=UPI001F5D12AB|nr:scarecrow-like protein 30 [Lolium rigidum]
MGSCEDVEYGDIYSVANPAAAPARMLDFSLHQPHLQFPPSYGFHGLPAAGYLPSPPQPLAFGSTPSPASTTTTELESPEDLSADDAVLAYINQFLLEDDDEEESFPSPGAAAPAAAPERDSALLAVAKPFVDIIADAAPYQETPWMDPPPNASAGTAAGFPNNMFMSSSSRQSSCQLVVPAEPVKEEGRCAVHRGRKKNRHDDDDGLELEDERRSKQSAVCDEEMIREMFDNVLLCNCPDCELQSPLPDESEITKAYVKGSGNRRGRKKGKTKAAAAIEEESVDLTTLLIHCAQAAAIDDHRSSGELLKQIRRHSSAHGDAGQRLAHYVANGLEARLAGVGSTVHRSLVAHRTSIADMLKIYTLYGTACPFLRMSRFFSNQAILQASKGAARLHIIDYGIDHGFQWPVFLQRVAKLDGPHPRIRITAIDLPQPGFRPAERIEATGRRLHDYARMYNIPFEYHAIAAKWDTIRIEDLRIDKDELLIVNCLFRMRHMMDETVTDQSPRMTVLNTIRKLNPHLFIHAVVNGTYNAPFFVTRFKEALFYFSSLFDMLETTASKLEEQEHRMLIERDFFAREALNVIACEGTERVERPETYKQWQVRNLRAGFRQQPLNQETVKKARYKVTRSYNKDFFVDEDNKWMLQGWKGRVIVAMSTWKPS